MGIRDGVEFLPETGTATACQLGHHRPLPLRFVWHHIQPQVCGGLTVPSNLASLCDNCHYAVHALLWNLKVNAGSFLSIGGSNGQRALAGAGYAAALKAGTVDKIPNEGHE